MVEKGIALFFAGSLMAMVIYHVILYLLYRKAKEYLLLGLLCLGILFRTLSLTSNGIPLQAVLSTMPFEFFKKLEYISVYALMGVLPLYFQRLFPDEFPKLPLRLFVTAAVIFSIVPLFTRFPLYHNLLLDSCHIIYVSELATIGFVLYSATLNKKSEAHLTFIAMACAAPLILLEIMSNSGIITIHLPFLLELSMLTFLIFQAFMLAKRNAKAYHLAQLTQHELKKEVESQTRQLLESNQLKDMVLSIMSHDIKSPLNSIKGVLCLINSGFIKPEEIKRVTSQLEEQVHNTSMLVENILHWCASQTKSITIRKAKIQLRPLIDECFSLFTFQARSKRVDLVNRVPRDAFVIADENVMKLVLRNLVSNALKFSHTNGHIIVSAKREQEIFTVIIEDNGVGIPLEKIEGLFDIDNNVSTIGTKQEVGTGLGLSICKKFLNAMGSSIAVESDLNLGARFFIHIPQDQPDTNFNSVMYVESRVA